MDQTTRGESRFRFHRIATALVCTLALAAAARADSLTARINALLPDVEGASVGIHIVEVTKKGPVELYGHNADTPLGPASNMKILTTAAAFEKYGPKATFKTQLYRVGDDFVLVGSGDPAFCDAKLFAEKGWSVTAIFDHWGEQLAKAGIKKFGDLIVNDSVFDATFTHPNWPEDQRLAWYQAPVGGLNFNANCLDWKPKITNRGIGIELIPDTSYVSVAITAKRGSTQQVWLWRPADANAFQMRGTVAASATEAESVTIVDPGLWTGTILRDRLTTAGVASTGTVRRVGDKPLANAKPELLAVYETPLLSILQRANKQSVNMMAECLCKRLGHDATGKPGSWENGTAAVTDYLAGLGVQGNLVNLDDGSGLSPKNKVAPRAFTAALAHVAARADGDQYVQTFAVPGEEGTLKRRFKGVPAGAGIHAKTGHIKGVSTLSGYLDVGERRFAFSILVNKFAGNANGWQEEVCNEIWKWASSK